MRLLNRTKPRNAADLAQTVLIFTIGVLCASDGAFARSAVVSFEATLQRFIAPRGEALETGLPEKSIVRGEVEIDIDERDGPEQGRIKGPMAGNFWPAVVKRLELTGALNAVFTGGLVYLNADSMSVLNVPYQNATMSCAGPGSGCDGDGDVFRSISGETSRQLHPRGFFITRDRGHGGPGHGNLSLTDVVRVLGSVSSEGDTRLVIDLAEPGSDIADRNRNAKMLWSITRSTIVR